MADARTRANNPNCSSNPANGFENEMQRIRVIEGMTGFIPTVHLVLTVEDAESFHDEQIGYLGFTREHWTALAAWNKRAETCEPGNPTEHGSARLVQFFAKHP